MRTTDIDVVLCKILLNLWLLLQNVPGVSPSSGHHVCQWGGFRGEFRGFNPLKLMLYNKTLRM